MTPLISSALRLLLPACLAATAALPVHAQTTRRINPATITNRVVLSGTRHVEISADSLNHSGFNFESPDAWLFIKDVPPAKVIADHMERLMVSYEPAFLNGNVRIHAFENGTVVIPHGPHFAAMTAFSDAALKGTPTELKAHTRYNGESLGALRNSIRSFRLKRGYMATLAQNENGTGISKNYVAQDHDLEIKSLPAGLDQSVRFIRIFPWRWTSKKGICGNIHQDLNVGWYYNWNLNANSTPELEYVPIRQTRWWPPLNQDWQQRGATHLLGYNEPDKADQAKMSVDEAIAGWPDLLATGLRLGSPAVSDGGLKWLYEFMEKADKANLRVDFVAVHYYRAVPNPGDGKAAANQFRNFLEEIHRRTKRPIWITEWNNGANWTKHRDPNPKEQREAIAEMIKMLDKTPFVERYALYNWVEDSRSLKIGDGPLTPAGEAYRDQRSPVSYQQEK